MCEKVLHMLKARRYAYLENLNCKESVLNCDRTVLLAYRSLMAVKISLLTEIIEEIEREQKQDDIIIA